MGELRPVLTASPSTSTVPATARRGCKRSINVSTKNTSISEDSLDENLGFPIAIASWGLSGFATKLLQFITLGLIILRSLKEVSSVSKIQSWQLDWVDLKFYKDCLNLSFTIKKQMHHGGPWEAEQIMGFTLLNNTMHGLVWIKSTITVKKIESTIVTRMA